MPAIIKQFQKKNIKVKLIGEKKFKGTWPFNFKKFEYRSLEIKNEATTSIFWDYISIHLIKDKPLIIIIKNKEIAQGYRNHFNLLWEIAK